MPRGGWGMPAKGQGTVGPGPASWPENVCAWGGILQFDGRLTPPPGEFAAPGGERLELLIVLIFKGMQNPAPGTNQTDLNLRYLRTLVMRCMKMFRISQPL